MLRRERLANAARTLKPLEQGSLDGLCGLYAIINAIRLAHYPVRLTRPELAGLFATGLNELKSRKRLRSALIDGMPPAVVFTMADVLLDQAERLRGMPLTLRRPNGRDFSSAPSAVMYLRRSMHEGSPVIVGFEGRLDHWTVLARYSRARLSFFDSARHHWIAPKALGLPGDQLSHIVAHEAVAALQPP